MTDVATFRARFPEFAGVSDPLVQILLDEAGRAVDAHILESNYSDAVLYYAAHLASGAQRATALGQAGSIDQAVRMISFRDRSVGFHREPSQSGSGPESAGTAALRSSQYGLMFLALLKRSVPAIALI